jgi:hypothetical protein
MYGKKKVDTDNMVKHGVILPMLLFVSLNVNSFNSLIIFPLKDVFNGLSSSILSVSGGNTFELIGDNMMNILLLGWKDIEDAGIGSISLIFIGAVKMFSGLVIILSVSIIITRALIMIFIYSWLLNFTLWLWAFNSASFIPKEILRNLIAYFLHIPILSILFLLFDKITSEISTSILTNGLEDVLFVLVSSYAFFKLLDQISEVANVITKGQTNSTGASLTASAIMANIGADKLTKDNASNAMDLIKKARGK